MYQRVLLALDLEGVNNVAGEPYEGIFKDSKGWFTAREQAVLEVNAAAEALFDAGVKKVALWDNHGGTENVDPEKLDKRIELIKIDFHKPRMNFAKDNFDCICFFGYHAMEGTLGGVLAHTMSSASIQYYKLNGKYIGEVDMDAYIAGSHSMPAVFFCGGNIACRQAQRAIEGIVTVETKTELERNKAIFRNNEELLLEIKEKIVKAVSMEKQPCMLKAPCIFEKSFKRMEDAAKYLERLEKSGIEAMHPDDDILIKDAHTVVSVVHSIDEFIKCI